MRKLLVIAVLMSILSSCSLMYDIQDDVFYDEIGDGYSLYTPEWIDEIDDISDVQEVISNHITYESESGDTWQSPETTCEKGTGDCEDYAILMIDILYLKFGTEANLAIVESDECRSVVNGSLDVDHAIVECDGVYYEATAKFYKTYDDVTVCYRYTFDELFKEVN